MSSNTDKERMFWRRLSKLILGCKHDLHKFLFALNQEMYEELQLEVDKDTLNIPEPVKPGKKGKKQKSSKLSLKLTLSQ